MPGTSEARITSSGQMSLPISIRKRWGTRAVVVVDKGDYAIVRPLPEDVPSALKGSLPAKSGISSEQMRADERAAEGSGRHDR